MKISMKHNKKSKIVLNFLTNCISARSAPQIFSVKDDYTFRFLDFLKIG